MANRALAPLLVAVWSVTILSAAAPAQLRSTPETTLRGNRVLVIAHRGGAKEATENTIPAFERAMRLGANGIETDLRLTRDGVVVIKHDDRYGRVEGLPSQQRTRLVSDMTYAELSAQPLTPTG
ncbi:MAG TPA: glycerophosphodiester phosphodiesterase family protein, partial [Blastocatellia bacterium]|nr:glycerophosphodiester phosphodiesterase family protein [Blastocatellia bacterium]